MKNKNLAKTIFVKKKLYNYFFKGQSNELFKPIPGPLTNGLKYFRFLLKNSPSYSNFSVSPVHDTPASQSFRYPGSQSPQSVIPRRVN